MPLRALLLAPRCYCASDVYCSTRPLELRSLLMYTVLQPSTYTQSLAGVGRIAEAECKTSSHMIDHHPTTRRAFPFPAARSYHGLCGDGGMLCKLSVVLSTCQLCLAA